MKHFSKLYLVVLLVLLFSPVWMQNSGVIKLQPLAGDFAKPINVSFNLENWFSTSYQEASEENLLVRNAFSPLFIRIYNQLDYSLFNQVHMQEGVLGKNDYLFSIDYINTYIGKDKKPDSIFNDYALKMKFVSDTLEKLNKHLIYVQSPGKASYFPEYFPDSIPTTEDLNSNYYKLMRKLKEYKVTHIDFRKYFIENKNKFKYPMFTQTGIHWSEYSMPVVMDSIVQFLNTQYELHIPSVKIEKVEESIAKLNDKDIEAAMNLLFQINGPTYAYPTIQFPKENKTGVKMLLVSDSYMGNVYHGGFYHCFQEDSQFWFYNKSVECENHFKDVHVLQLRYIKEALKHDLIIISATESNCAQLSWDFIDDLYYYFKDGTTLSEKKKTLLKKAEAWKLELKKDESSAQKEAQPFMDKFHISYDSALLIKSIWDVEQKRNLQNSNKK